MSEKKTNNIPTSTLMNRGPGGPGARARMGERAHVNDTKKAILRLWNYLSKDKWRFIMAMICVITSTLFSLLASYMVRPIINGILQKTGTTILIQQLAMMFFIYLTALLANYFQARLMLIIAQQSLAKLREDLFFCLSKLPLSYFDAHNNGDLMSRFTNDVDAVSQMLSSTCIQLISGIITFVTTLAIMAYTNILLTLMTIIVAPLCSMVLKYITSKSRVYYKQQQASIGDLNGFIEESITGQKVIKVFNHEEEIIEDFKKKNQNYKKRSFLAQFLGGSMGPIMGGLGQLSYVLIAGIGGIMCVNGYFDIGGFTIFLGYSKGFSRPINDIFMQINTIYSALAGAERVFEVMDQPPEIQDTKTSIEPFKMMGEVVFKDVNFSYIENKSILKGINLSVTPGMKVAFVGSTGAGKTTITNLLNRFYEINQGEIIIDGVNIKRFTKDFLRQNIATVLQDTHLFSGTIMENIRYGRLDASDNDVIEAAKVANADSFIRRLEHGYETMIDADGSNLSQGQRQLLNIARAAISKTPILVLDEATSSVDTRTEKNIEEALDRLMSSRTTFVIAHRLSTVRNSDMIIVLESGEIIERGNHQELLNKKGKYHSLYTGTSQLE